MQHNQEKENKKGERGGERAGLGADGRPVRGTGEGALPNRSKVRGPVSFSQALGSLWNSKVTIEIQAVEAVLVQQGASGGTVGQQSTLSLSHRRSHIDGLACHQGDRKLDDTNGTTQNCHALCQLMSSKARAYHEKGSSSDAGVSDQASCFPVSEEGLQPLTR